MDIKRLVEQAHENAGKHFSIGKVQSGLASWHKGRVEQVCDALAYLVQAQEIEAELPGIEAEIAELDAWLEENREAAEKNRRAIERQQGKIDTTWYAPRDPKNPERREEKVSAMERELREKTGELGPLIEQYKTKRKIRNNLAMIAEALRKIEPDEALLADLGIGGKDG